MNIRHITCEARRSWRERLTARPWRPWRKWLVIFHETFETTESGIMWDGWLGYHPPRALRDWGAGQYRVTVDVRVEPEVGDG